MENKMAEVAKLLGVELGEEFGLKNSNFRYKLTKYGLHKKYFTEKNGDAQICLMIYYLVELKWLKQLNQF